MTGKITLIEDVERMHGRIDDLDGRINMLTIAVNRNTAATEDMRDILGTFRTVGKLAKWMSIVTAAIGGIVSIVKGWK